MPNNDASRTHRRAYVLLTCTRHQLKFNSRCGSEKCPDSSQEAFSWWWFYDGYAASMDLMRMFSRVWFTSYYNCGIVGTPEPKIRFEHQQITRSHNTSKRSKSIERTQILNHVLE